MNRIQARSQTLIRKANKTMASLITNVNDLCQFVNGIGALNEDQKVATFKLLNDCGVTVESLSSLDNDDLKTMGVPFPVWKPLLAGIANPGNPVSLLEVTMFQKLFQFVNNIGALNEDQKEATFKLLNDCGVTFESLDSLDKDDLKTMGVPYPVWKPLLAAIANPVSGGILLSISVLKD